MRIWCLVLALVTLIVPSHAETIVDVDELEAWADDYLGTIIDEKRASGVTISVIQNGETVFARGYGHQDLKKGIPTSPETSKFIVGSITKTFIATAIGQLVDGGHIASLDDPANKYLSRVQLPGDRGAKITIRMLLNHRAGFEDVDFGFMDKTGPDVAVPLTSAEILRFMPDIVMEPGGYVNYSNWSFSLLGFLIEDITGMRVDEYLKQNIWRPLGMTNTGMLYPHNPENLSVSYTFEKDGTPHQESLGLPHPWIGPAGTVASTAGDIAKYMRTHVKQGEDGGYPIVSKEMFKTLHTETFRNAPIFAGFAHTFWTDTINGVQSIEHGGGAPGFQSMMLMLPEKDFGFFMSVMQGGLVSWESYSDEEIDAGKDVIKPATTGFELRQVFIERFLDQAVPKKGTRKADPLKLVGTYISEKRVFTTVESLSQTVNPAVVLKISLAENGRDIVYGENTFTDLGDGLFKNVTSDSQWIDPYALDMFSPPYMYFGLNADGTPSHLVAALGDQVWKPTSSVYNPVSMLYLFGLCTIVLATGILMFAWPGGGHFGNSLNWLVLVPLICAVTFPLAVMAGFDQGDSIIGQMARGEKGRFWIMVIAANLGVVAALFLIWRVVRNWAGASDSDRSSLIHKLHATVLAIAAVGIVVAFHFFNFVGINMPG